MGGGEMSRRRLRRGQVAMPVRGLSNGNRLSPCGKDAKAGAWQLVECTAARGSEMLVKRGDG